MTVGKYEKKLSKTLLAIGVSLVTLLMVVFDISVMTTMQNRYLDSLRQTANSRRTSAEIALNTISSMLNSLMRASALEDWSVSRNSTEYYFYGTLASQQIQKATSSLSMVDYQTAVTMLDDTSFVISRDGTNSKERFFRDETTLSQEQVTEIFEHFKTSNSALTKATFKDGNLQEIYYILKKQYERSDLLFIVKIPSKTLFDSQPGEPFLLWDSGGIIAYSNDSKKNQRFLQDMQKKILALPPERVKTNPVRISHQNACISHFTATDWTVAYFYPDAGLTPFQIVGYLVLPFVTLLAAGVLLTRRVSRKLYSPLQEVMEDILMETTPEQPAGNGEVDEFQILRQNAKSIKQLTTQLEAALSEKEELASQRFYRDLLFGINVRDKSSYQKYLSEDLTGFCVALVEFQESPAEYRDDDIFLCKSKLYSLVQEHPRIKYVNVTHSTCALLLLEDSLEEARKQIIEVVSAAQEDLQLIISLSDIRKGMDSVHTSFLEAEKILEYKYLFGNTILLTMKQIAEADSSNYYYPLVTENALIQHMVNGNDAAITVLNTLLQENFENRSLMPDTLRGFLFALIGTLNRVYQELKTTPLELLGKDVVLEQLYRRWNDSNIVFLLKEQTEEIVRAVQKKKIAATDQMLEDMLQYIYQNYADDIMLRDMAMKFDVSPKYCSALFKKLSDEHFKDFLNRYRIEKSKEFLKENSTMKISDLSVKVGFNSSNTFIRVFSKYVGETPKAFAERVEEEQ